MCDYSLQPTSASYVGSGSKCEELTLSICCPLITRSRPLSGHSGSAGSCHSGHSRVMRHQLVRMTDGPNCGVSDSIIDSIRPKRRIERYRAGVAGGALLAGVGNDAGLAFSALATPSFAQRAEGGQREKALRDCGGEAGCWARAIRDKNIDAAVSHYARDILLYDLAPPLVHVAHPAIEPRYCRTRGGLDLGWPARARDPLDGRSHGQSGRDQRQFGPAHLARPWPAAPPDASVQAVQ